MGSLVASSKVRVAQGEASSFSSLARTSPVLAGRDDGMRSGKGCGVASLGKSDLQADPGGPTCQGLPLGGDHIQPDVAELDETQGREEQEDEFLQDLEELRVVVYAAKDEVKDLPRKARNRQLAPARRFAERMGTVALSPEAAAVLAEIQLCLG